ncbi:transmembrane protein 14C-like [Centruroides vittatus]|uniref:transmembrane protein 14C-like n=1 Tax=Centruroides vittatus TaxID=120091 RepID=UPI00351045FA
MATDIISYAYSALVAVGGIVGYMKAGSISSLIAGLAFGVILTFGAYQTSQDPNNCYLSLGASIVLAGVMGSRFLNSGKFMPAGLIMSLSLMMVIRCLKYVLFNRRQSQ